MADSHRSGFVAVIGRPNVGKSTLLNTILGQKIAIVSAKPQTTRTRILGVLTKSSAQIMFIDTPGIHKPLHKLGEKLVQTSERVLNEADIVLWVVDAAEKISGGEEYISQKIAKCSGQLVLAVNKTDKVNRELLLTRMAAYGKLADFAAVIPVSAIKGDNIELLITELEKLLPAGPQYYPEDTVTDQPERVVAAEIIREKVIHNTFEEVPHAIAVLVDEMKLRANGDTYIGATIFVERDSQKGIVIGAGGRNLKLIGQQARLDIEWMLDGKVFLELWVKVKPNWRKSDSALRLLGYTDNH